MSWFFFFQAEDGIRDLVRSRGLGDVYKRQGIDISHTIEPLNDAGTVSYDNGQVLFIGMGGSNASNAYNMLSLIHI